MHDKKPRVYSQITREVELGLVAKAKAGDSDSWVLLYHRHLGFLVHRIRRYAGRYASLNHAEDLESEGRRAFAMTIQQFDPARKVRLVTLLGLLVRRVVLDYLARETKLCVDGVPPLSLDDHAPEDDRESVCGKHLSVEPTCRINTRAQVESRDTRKALYKALAELSPQARFILLSRYVEGCHIEDLQQHAYGRPVPRERVHADIERALRKLRLMM